MTAAISSRMTHFSGTSGETVTLAILMTGERSGVTGGVGSGEVSIEADSTPEATGADIGDEVVYILMIS